MQIGTITPDNLLAGNFPVVTEWLDIPQALKRGTIVTASGEAMASGGEPFGVLTEDTEGGQAPVYLTGEFSRNHLILAGGAGLAAADVKSLRALSIFAKNTLPAA